MIGQYSVIYGMTGMIKSTIRRKQKILISIMTKDVMYIKSQKAFQLISCKI